MEQLLAFAPVALTPARRLGEQFQSWWLDPPLTACSQLLTPSFPPDITPKTASAKETPASLFLQGTGDSLASERIAKCC